MAVILRGVFAEQHKQIADLLQVPVIKRLVSPKPIDLSALGWDEELAKRIQPQIQLSFVQGMQQVALQVGVDPQSLRLAAESVRQAIRDVSLKFAKSTNDTTTLEISEAIKRTREAIEANVIDVGGTDRMLSKELGKVFDRAERFRTDRIAITETSRALHAGQLAEARASGVVIKLKWLLSAAPCEVCLGIVRRHPKGVRLGTPFLQSPGPFGTVLHPPAHPNCILGDVCVVAPGLRTAMMASYSGPVVRIELSNGVHLTATPQHMLLTPLGFASVACLRKGDNVVNYTFIDRNAVCNPDYHRGPSSAEDVIASLSVSKGMTTARVPVSPEYLHGDAVFAQGDIDVISTNGFFEGGFKSTASKLFGEIGVEFRDSKLFPFAGGGDLAAVLLRLRAATDGGVGIRRQSATFLRRQPVHADRLSLAHCSKWDAAFSEDSPDNRTADAEVCRKLNLSGIGGISTAQVVSVDVHDFRGHVYDLHTNATLYLANGLVSSNCQCSMLSLTGEPTSDRIDRPIAPNPIQVSRPRPTQVVRPKPVPKPLPKPLSRPIPQAPTPTAIEPVVGAPTSVASEIPGALDVPAESLWDVATGRLKAHKSKFTIKTHPALKNIIVNDIEKLPNTPVFVDVDGKVIGLRDQAKRALLRFADEQPDMARRLTFIDVSRFSNKGVQDDSTFASMVSLKTRFSKRDFVAGRLRNAFIDESDPQIALRLNLNVYGKTANDVSGIMEKVTAVGADGTKWLAVEANIEGTIAHELGHAIDYGGGFGGGKHITRTLRKWLVTHKVAAGDLSQYATVDIGETIAEGIAALQRTSPTLRNKWLRGFAQALREGYRNVGIPKPPWL